jgi:hypothetical protein
LVTRELCENLNVVPLVTREPHENLNVVTVTRELRENRHNEKEYFT